MEPVRAAVIYYSATGAVHALAQAGAEVRLRKVAETALPETINAKPAWADVVLFGTPPASATRRASCGRSWSPRPPCGSRASSRTRCTRRSRLQAARYQARRAVDTAAALKAGCAA